MKSTFLASERVNSQHREGFKKIVLLFSTSYYNIRLIIGEDKVGASGKNGRITTQRYARLDFGPFSASVAIAAEFTSKWIHWLEWIRCCRAYGVLLYVRQ